jgi:hypothetical protein
MQALFGEGVRLARAYTGFLKHYAFGDRDVSIEVTLDSATAGYWVACGQTESISVTIRNDVITLSDSSETTVLEGSMEADGCIRGGGGKDGGVKQLGELSGSFILEPRVEADLHYGALQKMGLSLERLGTSVELALVRSLDNCGGVLGRGLNNFGVENPWESEGLGTFCCGQQRQSESYTHQPLQEARGETAVVGTCRLNAQYYCTIQSYVWTASTEITVKFIAVGDMSEGELQDPMASTISWDSGKVTPEAQHFTHEDRCFRISGSLVFRNVPRDRDLNFTYGRSGFTSIALKALNRSLEGLCQQHGRDAVVEALGYLAREQMVQWASDPNPKRAGQATCPAPRTNFEAIDRNRDGGLSRDEMNRAAQSGMIQTAPRTASGETLDFGSSGRGRSSDHGRHRGDFR